jgi:pre-mRNA-splicing helicase BRR2
LYVATKEEIIQSQYNEWNEMFAKLGKTVMTLTGETSRDLKILRAADIVLSTAERFDVISRRWSTRTAVQNIGLAIIDEIHLIGSEGGAVLEIVVSRLRYMSSQLTKDNEEKKEAGKPIKKPLRIVALGGSIANATDVASWIGATSHTSFNFPPNTRPVTLDVHLQGFTHHHHKARFLSMMKPLLYHISGKAEDKPVLIFTASRKNARQVRHT